MCLHSDPLKCKDELVEIQGTTSEQFTCSKLGQQQIAELYRINPAWENYQVKSWRCRVAGKKEVDA